MTTTLTTVDELEPGDTFSFPDDHDGNLYVLDTIGWDGHSVLPVRLVYRELGATDSEVHRIAQWQSVLVEVWS